MSNHTPGPYTLSPPRLPLQTMGRDILSDSGRVGFVYGHVDEDNIANSELIAASPELAECLSELVSILRDATTFMQYTEEKARAAALLERLGM